MADPLTLGLVDRHPGDAARLLETESPEDIAAIVANLPPPLAGRLLGQLNAAAAAACLRVLDESDATPAIENLPIETAATLLARLDRGRRAELIESQPPPRSAALRLILRFPAGTVGSEMDPAATSVRATMKVGDAIELARHAPESLRKYIYVVDDEHRLTGTVDVRQCLFSAHGQTIAALARPDPVVLRARSSLTEAARSEGWTRFQILPVVGRGNSFLGVLRRRTVEAALADEPQSTDTELTSTFIELAELYWSTSAHLFVDRPGTEPSTEERDRDR